MSGEPFVRWDWVLQRTDRIWALTIEHLQLTAWSVGIGLVVASILSLAAMRWRRTANPIVWTAGVVYTIPSLALLALLLPFTGLSRTTALIALVSYTLLILVRSILAGFAGVPAGVREAAAAMGYGRWRVLWAVELPLALPVVVAGVRIATVTLIGLVTITALIGQGGLGTLILDGLRRDFPTPIVVGSVLSVLLATVLDILLVGVGRVLTPWTRARSR
ncbi:MAG TPA: ABC transporter permease [Actinomycetota bacterium]|nr:ABC transporter permease [Actinomycetota bacterium]